MKEFVLLNWKSKKTAFVDVLGGFNKDHVYTVYFKVHPKYMGKSLNCLRKQIMNVGPYHLKYSLSIQELWNIKIWH